ncbi:MAG: penicillin-binding protein [Acidobacteria bacterium OLB17]|nr:MAG: penicillin-binding protein [Acidobacteria bacterium OLB17]
MNLLLALIDWKILRPEYIFGGQVLERTPAGLSILYLACLFLLLGFIAVFLLETLRRPRLTAEKAVPPTLAKRLTVNLANRSIFVWQMFFVLAALTVFGFHVYWTKFADEENDKFQALAYKDLRRRRTSAADLRGWILDRTGKLDSTLAYYKLTKDGAIERSYPLDREMAHLLGSERGTPGLERTLFSASDDLAPEAWDILFKYRQPEPVNKDVRLTIDRQLQQFVAKQLEGKKGAIVVLNPQTGDVLALYSNPSYSLDDVRTNDGYLRLETDRENQPLLSRAMRQFYPPGSTFKTLTMVSAFRAGKQDALFPDLPSTANPPCYTPFRGSRPICDAGGSCEICRMDVPLREAFKVSSNQYFAQLANYLGRERMAETARQFGIATVDEPKDALVQGFFPQVWNASSNRIANSLSPRQSTMVVGKDLTLYDFGLEGMGQGLASQMTPFQMALIAAGVGNLKGQLIKPKIEADLPPVAFSQVLSPQQAAIAREIMSTVTEEPGGTGGRVRALLAGTGIAAGGKTGTAEQDDVPVYDENGRRKFTIVKKDR